MRVRIWDNTPDQKGDKILVKNIDLSRYEQNPILIYLHGGYGLPVGNVVNLEKSADGLYGEIQFDDDENDYFGQVLKKKYEKGVMRGVSPRFFAYDPTDLGGGITEYGRAELVEISLVTLPSHKNAVVLKKNLGDDLPEGAVELNPFVPIPEPTEPKQKPEMKELFKSLGLAADEANEAKAINAVADLKKSLDLKDKELDAEKLKVTNLEKKLADQEQEAHTKEVDALVDGAVNAKKIPAGQAAHYKELCKSADGKFNEAGFKSVKSILEGMEPAKSISDTLAASGASDLQKKLAERESWDFDKWAKEDSDGLAELKEKNPQKFEDLKKALK